jgi:hypothetical protein
MYGWKTYLPGFLFLVAMTPLVYWSTPSKSSGVGPSNPRQIEEVLAIAQNLGLHCRGDRQDGQIQMRLLVSDSPLTWERVGQLYMGRGEHTDWVGTVSVMQGVKKFPPMAANMTPWGNFLLYGDPALIRKLTGRAGPDES